MNRRRNNLSVFLEPGMPPFNESQAAMLLTCSGGARISTLYRKSAPQLFPPKRYTRLEIFDAISTSLPE